MGVFALSPAAIDDLLQIGDDTMLLAEIFDILGSHLRVVKTPSWYEGFYERSGKVMWRRVVRPDDIPRYTRLDFADDDGQWNDGARYLIIFRRSTPTELLRYNGARLMILRVISDRDIGDEVIRFMARR